ncbi:MAG TPA: hypothetical protein VKB93_25460 [Thermoanaerobaculia bacterium]|nr:hypothetical protein [Thermoanaerobaculia bacterium]
MVPRFSLALVFLLAFPALASIQSSPERELSPRDADQQAPGIAAAGELRLVIWKENQSLIATRIDANRTVLDAAPIDIGVYLDETSQPHVASNGTDWLVAWQRATFVEGVRIRHDGTLVDATPLRIAGEAMNEAIGVTWDGRGYVVVFDRGSSSAAGLRAQIFAVRVESSGAIGLPFAISERAWNWHVAIASGPEGSLIVWSEYDRLRGALLSRGDTVTPLGFPNGYGRKPAAAWNGETFLVAAGTWSGELRILLVDAHGNARESISPIVPRSTAFAGYVTLDVEPLGNGFLLYWSESGKLIAAVINRDGFVADGPAIVGETLGGYFSSFAAAGAQFVTQHASRVFVQSLQWTPEPAPKRRAARF